MDIRKIHEELFVFLTTLRLEDASLNFSLRRSNRDNKLEQGYWFYGNEDYLAVSFWSGMDWKNKTPNIYFVIINDGSTYLEIAVSDSDKKRDFIQRYLLNTDLQLEKDGKRYNRAYSEYPREDYLISFQNFLQGDKIKIDNIIRENESFFSDQPDVAIGFIKPDVFEPLLQKTTLYRSHEIDLPDRNLYNTLSGFRIQNFGPIKDTGFIDIPGSIRWVFFTGENGTGKSSLLRALTSVICHAKVETTEQIFSAKIQISDHDRYYNIVDRIDNDGIKKRKPILKGFCAYGASRLKTSHSTDSNLSIKKALSKEGIMSSLFDSDSVLIDIQHQLNLWERNIDLIDLVNKRKENIEELLIDLLPNVHRVEFSKQGEWTETLYIEKDNLDNELEPVTFDKLASGLKSIVAMIGDMMMRLFNQQPEKSDPADLEGVVIIDEIDIHLHPNLQKEFVEQLTKTFPRVQFFASTHSPIPLLGAPANTYYYKVERDLKNGVTLTDLNSIPVSSLMPNALLTSDLFGMSKLFNSKTDIEFIKTENYYKDIIFNDSVRAQLKVIAKQLKDKNNQ